MILLLNYKTHHYTKPTQITQDTEPKPKDETSKTMLKRFHFTYLRMLRLNYSHVALIAVFELILSIYEFYIRLTLARKPA